MIAIQDLVMLDNGLLLSCAYDGKIKCWRYNQDYLYGEVYKENMELKAKSEEMARGAKQFRDNSDVIMI